MEGINKVLVDDPKDSHLYLHFTDAQVQRAFNKGVIAGGISAIIGCIVGVYLEIWHENRTNKKVEEE